MNLVEGMMHLLYDYHCFDGYEPRDGKCEWVRECDEGMIRVEDD